MNMTPEEINAAQYANWQSRKETLKELLHRGLEKLDEADPEEAVCFTNSLAIMLVNFHHNAVSEVNRSQADDIINNALNP